MNLEDIPIEDLLAQLNEAPEEYAIDDFDRWCINHGVTQGEHIVHQDWLYKLYLLSYSRNPKRYRKTPFIKRLSKNLKLEGENFYCNTSLDAFKRVLSESGVKEEGKATKGITMATNRFKRFIEAAGLKSGDTAIRMDLLYNIYLDYCKRLGRNKHSRYKVFEDIIPTLLKTKTTLNHLWAMVDPDYKKDFRHVEEEESQGEVEVQSVRPVIESEDEV